MTPEFEDCLATIEAAGLGLWRCEGAEAVLLSSRAAELIGTLERRLGRKAFLALTDPLDRAQVGRHLWSGEANDGVLYFRAINGARLRLAGSGQGVLMTAGGDGRADDAHSRLAAIVASSDDAIVRKSLDGIVIDWNRGAEEIFGFRADEIIGQSIALIVPPDRREESATILQRMRQGERIDHFETRRQRKDGSVIDVSITISPVYDEKGRLLGASKVARDITQNRRGQQRLQELQAELIHMSRFTALGEMASTLAHELNQPLTAVASYLKGAGRLLDSGGSAAIATARDAIERAAQQALRAGQIIRRLREFVARGEGERQIENLAKLIEEACALALVGARQSGVKVSVAFESTATQVLADKIQIQQVLLNLVRNAIEAMQDGDRRELSLSTHRIDAETVRIDVADSGPGIAPEIAPQLFQPFVTTKQSGMGVGLSISRTIIESHGGRLWVDPNPGGGVIFHVALKSIEPEELVHGQ